MAFSSRERLILLVTVVVLGALVLDRFALTPLLDRWRDVEARKSVLTSRTTKAESLLQRRGSVEPRWRRMLAGSMKRDPGEAESQVLHALGRWARETGVNLVSLRPERSADETLLPEVDFRASAAGRMDAVSRFLWRLETADIPLRIKSLQLTARKEGADDLSLQLKFSTLYAPPESADEAATGGNETRPKGDRS